MTGFVLNPIVVRTPPRAVVFRYVAVVRGVADRPVNKFSSKISVPGVAEGLRDYVNEHVVEGDWLIAPPRHRTDIVKIECLNRCIRSRARSAITPDNVISRFVRTDEEIGVVLYAVLEPKIGLAHVSTENGTEVTEFDTRQMLDDSEEVGPARNEGATSVILRKTVQLPDGGVASGLQVTMQYLLHGVTEYTGSSRISLAVCQDWPENLVQQACRGDFDDEGTLESRNKNPATRGS